MPRALNKARYRNHLAENNHDPNCRVQRNCSKLDILFPANGASPCYERENPITNDLAMDVLCLNADKRTGRLVPVVRDLGEPK